MEQFTVRELQNINSYREGTTIEAESLSAAKRKAGRMQCFHGTVMVIENKDGIVVSTKWDGKRWKDKSQNELDASYSLR